MIRVAVFGYASLASPESASQTIGRPVEFAGVARLQGWRRAWTLGREQAESEKTFARADGSIPRFCLGLNVEPDPDAPAPNGVLIEITEAELDRLDVREVRYDRVDVTAAIAVEGERPGTEHGFDRVIAYTAKPRHHHPTAPDDAVIVSTYPAADRGGVRRARAGSARCLQGDHRAAAGAARGRHAGPRRDPAGQPAGLVTRPFDQVRPGWPAAGRAR